mmetsp:Transcript_14832/g.48584  ORF Transcript_14832/g.48584 Transcript_14832/m.48584 type:complete len:269 (+) Transcript_14832:839-1645(+)
MITASCGSATSTRYPRTDASAWCARPMRARMPHSSFWYVDSRVGGWSRHSRSAARASSGGSSSANSESSASSRVSAAWCTCRSGTAWPRSPASPRRASSAHTSAKARDEAPPSVAASAHAALASGLAASDPKAGVPATRSARSAQRSSACAGSGSAGGAGRALGLGSTASAHSPADAPAASHPAKPVSARRRDASAMNGSSSCDVAASAHRASTSAGQSARGDNSLSRTRRAASAESTSISRTRPACPPNAATALIAPANSVSRSRAS